MLVFIWLSADVVSREVKNHTISSIWDDSQRSNKYTVLNQHVKKGNLLSCNVSYG